MEDVPVKEKPREQALRIEGPERRHKKGRKRVRGFLILLLFLLGFAIFFNLNFKTVVVSGESMVPTFENGQKVVVSDAYWLVGPLQKKDIVVIRDTGPTGYIIKRIYRTAGETVDWANAPDDHRLIDGRFRVPDGTVYVLGDNRMHSEDSREFGPVDVNTILGKVVVIPW
ncbi:MAG TPA: S26 family signal peptidase [Fimbriimonas sp.]